jgi:hypothetical protein
LYTADYWHRGFAQVRVAAGLDPCGELASVQVAPPPGPAVVVTMSAKAHVHMQASDFAKSRDFYEPPINAGPI